MTYQPYYSSYYRHELSEAEKADRLAEQRRRANENLMLIRAQAPNRPKAWM